MLLSNNILLCLVNLSFKDKFLSSYLKLKKIHEFLSISSSLILLVFKILEFRTYLVIFSIKNSFNFWFLRLLKISWKL